MKKYRIYKLVAIALVVILAFVIYLPATSISCAEESLNNLNKMTLADVLAGKISPYDYYGMLDVSVVPDAVG